jgi:hypothetical protein
MALSTAQRTGFAICLVLTILLVGLHFAGTFFSTQSLPQATSSSRTTMSINTTSSLASPA